MVTAVHPVKAKPKCLRQLFYLFKTQSRGIAERLFKQFAISHFAAKPGQGSFGLARLTFRAAKRADVFLRMALVGERTARPGSR